MSMMQGERYERRAVRDPNEIGPERRWLDGVFQARILVKRFGSVFPAASYDYCLSRGVDMSGIERGS